MKKTKVFMVLAVVAAGSSMVWLASCGKGLSCASAVINVSTAASNYANDQSTANCQAYKDALNKWLDNSKCSGADATTKAAFQEDLQDLGC